MTTRFFRAMNHTLPWEGGYVNDPDDPGRATNYGISLRFLLSLGDIEAYDYDGDGDIDAEDMRLMSKDQARAIYQRHFWRRAYDHIESEALAIKIFDFSVNMGNRQSTKLLQRAFNQWMLEYTSGSPTQSAMRPLRVDGMFGPKTFNATRDADLKAWDFLLTFENACARFYFNLAEKRRRSRKYLFGWLRRCYDRPGA